MFCTCRKPTWQPRPMRAWVIWLCSRASMRGWMRTEDQCLFLLLVLHTFLSSDLILYWARTSKWTLSTVEFVSFLLFVCFFFHLLTMNYQPTVASLFCRLNFRLLLQRNCQSKCRLQTQIRPPVIGCVVAYYLLIWSTARNDFDFLKSRASLMLKTPGHATSGWRSWCSHH